MLRENADELDGISTEMIEAAGESELNELTHLANIMFKEGCLPE